MRRSRRNRPGLIGTAARTAVVVGTASAVHGAVSGGGHQAVPQTFVVEQPAPTAAQAQITEARRPPRLSPRRQVVSSSNSRI